MLWRKILKTVFILTVSLNLSLIDFQFKSQFIGFNSAFAETNNSNSSATTSASTEGAQASKDIQVVEGKDIKSSSWAATLTMVAIGILTSRLVSCKMTMDMGLAAGAGAAFIAGEAIAFIKLRKALDGFKVELDALADKEKFDSQKQALIKIRNGYQKALETAEFKKNLQMVAAGVFLTAAGAAGMAGAQNTGGLVACSASLTGASATCNAMFSASCPKCYVPFKTGGIAATLAKAKTSAHNLKMKILGPSTAKEAESTASEAAISGAIASASAQCPAVSAATGTCNTFFGLRKMNSGTCAAATLIADRYQEKINNKTFTLEDLRQTNPSYWDKMMKVIIPEANAFDLSGIGVLASSAVKFVFATNKVLAAKVDTFLHEPYNRMKIWLALAGLTYMAKSSTEEVIGQLKEYIAKIDGVIAGYEDQKLGLDVAAGSQVKLPVTDFSENTKNEEIKLPGGKDSVVGLNGAASSKTETSTGSSNSVTTDYSIGQKMPCLAGESSGKCNSFSDMINNSTNFSTLDAKMQKQFQNIASTLDGLNGTDTIKGGTLSDLNAIAKNSATNYASAKEDLIKKYKIPKEELAGVDKNQNELLDAVNKELKKENTTAERMYASFNEINPSNFNSSKDDKKNANAANSKAEELAALGVGAGGIQGLSNNALSGLFSETSKDKNEVDHSAAQSEVKVDSSKAVDAAQINEIAGQFGDNELIDLSKMSGNLDINKDDQASLFQVISNRYQKSGFNRLFPNKKTYEIEAQR